MSQTSVKTSPSSSPSSLVPTSCPVSLPSPSPSQSQSPPQRPPRPKTSLPNLRPTIILSPCALFPNLHHHEPSRTRSQSSKRELRPEEALVSPSGSEGHVDVEKGEIDRCSSSEQDSTQRHDPPPKRGRLAQYRRLLWMVAVFSLVVLTAVAIVSGIIWKLSRRKLSLSRLVCGNETV